MVTFCMDVPEVVYPFKDPKKLKKYVPGNPENLKHYKYVKRNTLKFRT